MVISASFAFGSRNRPATGCSGPTGGTSVLSYTTVRRSRISDPESKKARRLVSFHVVDVVVAVVVAAEAVVVVESWFLCVRASSASGSSGDGDEIGDDRSSWLEVSATRAGGLEVVTGETGETEAGDSDRAREVDRVTSAASGSVCCCCCGAEVWLLR